ncbi:hypothetical protein PPYR_09901 [Photinus pyralis]|uniref:Nuclear pore complex protein Nup205 n=1 Tax=Photinus pyralis TaxID=7054 RepID=A0A1Y1K2V2_PHOPY|nr:nuclear pore complex protein Nup205 [Photinus pyralis]KAB0795840.1 hypothetical protein PPYR_09901 [Photinus pyralis]
MNEDSKTEDLWTPYKNLYLTLNHYLCEDGPNVKQAVFENLLRKHKQAFFALLQNPPKSAKSREELKKGAENGIVLKELGHQVLSKDLYQEAIILSDMYDLNEYVALDLLCTAHTQMPYYYGLPRGLVAVLLYYDGRKCVASSLRLLVQARKGVAWSFNIDSELSDYITSFTNELLENGLFSRIFELLHTLNLTKEIEKLQENVALGGPRHRKQVIDLFNDIRCCLAETVFLWVAQSGLPREPTLSLINYMRQLKVDEDATGNIDNVTFYLVMALLSVMDVSVLYLRDDGGQVVQTLPIMSDKEYMPMLCGELSPSKPKWVSEGLQSMGIFGLAVTTACLRFYRDSTDSQFATDKESALLQAAIDMKIFEFMKNKFLNSVTLYTDEILMRRFHCLLTDFIVRMYPKVIELRHKSDEVARVMQAYIQEGLEPPGHLARYFENFMDIIAKFYSKDPLNLHYSLDFWTGDDAQVYRASPRSISLNRFVQMAGESIPSSLFVPYLDMLSSLAGYQQSARHCFNLLKQSSGSRGATVSWDHFFMSFNQYYNNLRHEIGPTTDTMYRRAVHHKGITPQEIKGLHAVLHLIRTIADYDDFSRLALCEHPGWTPLTILLGLVGCAIPITIKADLLLTLAALSKSPETAAQTWHNLEVSQLLVTIPTTSSYQPRGLQTELDEIESRMEEYPLTNAVLKLLDVLTDSGIPRTLGAGPRKPGFDPYLTFIVNSVFLKFNARSYKNAEEKWMITSACLKLLNKFLVEYQPQAVDFSKTKEFNSPPGYHLMLSLNSKSEFLNVVLLIIEECLKMFLQCARFPGQSYVEDCAVCCLNILERALVLQRTFSKLATDVLLIPLNKLLLIPNPRTGQPDHCLNISKYMGLQYLLPQHALVAAKILMQITASPSLHAQYLNILLANEKESRLIRSGFVECLDAVINKDEVEILSSIKEQIFRLLRQCLSYGAPNLTHFLLGFDFTHDLSLTIFQKPGVLDFPRTCLHSIFTILKSAVSKDLQTMPPSLLETTYHILYLLCANYKTSLPILRYLRGDQKFFEDHLTFCVLKANEGTKQLNQLSWLLKTLAIELKVSCDGTQVFYVKQLCNMLVKTPEFVRSSPQSAFSVASFDKLLVTLFNKFDLEVTEIETPKWDHFEYASLENVIKSCETDTKPKMIDIKKLHHTLIDEIGSLHAQTAVGHKQALMQEVQKVLLHALSINNNRNSKDAIFKFIDAWRQVVEVIAIYVPYQILSMDEQQALCLTVLVAICKKTARISLLPEIAYHLSSVVLVLLEKLYQCHERQKDKEEETFIKANVHQESLKLVLTYLIEWLISTESTFQNLKINLYASLTTFFRFVHFSEPAKHSQIDGSFYVSRLDSSKTEAMDDRHTLLIPAQVFTGFGDKLIELICNDCVSGRDVVRMLAMSTLSLLISMSGDINWLMYMTQRGYLKHIIESVLNSDKELKLMLEPEPPSLRPQFVFISKMSLLSQYASTKIGAELLLEERMLSCLSNMNVFQAHPEILKQSQLPPDGLENFLPSIETRYVQIFTPTLHLCNTIITSVSSENRSAVSQIIYFLLSHLDVVEFVLRSGSPLLTQNFLEELSALTSIIARTAKSDLSYIYKTTEGVQDNRSRLYRIQKLMLALLPRFLLTQDVIRDLLLSNAITFQTSPRLILVFQILANIMTYVRNITNGDTDSANVTVFHPSLGDIFIGLTSKTTSDRTTLGVVVQHLVTIVNYWHEENVTLKFLIRKSNDIPTMTTVELKKFMNLTEIQNIEAVRENAADIIADKLKKKRQEFDYCAFLIDNLLYILWLHLDYYMLRAIPKMRHGELPDLSGSLNLNVTLASASEATWKVSTDDLSNLKRGLVSVFNDSFSRQLIETTEGRSEVNIHFVEILLRKIKRLIQFVPVK